MLRVTPQLEQKKKMKQRLKKPSLIRDGSWHRVVIQRNRGIIQMSTETERPNGRHTTSLHCSFLSNEALLRGVFAGGRVAMGTVLRDRQQVDRKHVAATAPFVAPPQ
ncbi:hypothetical protein TNCV_2018061 [Trichonephila clavipes]|nr:hypothetical protein TNCV_2018061 [Trichonephila clavipes]